jgi:ABC-type multidrug transport system fused ATPase/permease subunit
MAAIFHIGSAFVGIVADISVLAAVLAALVLVDPVLASCAVAYLAIIGVAYAWAVRRPLTNRGRVLQDAHERMTNVLLEFLGGLQEFVLRGTTKRQVDRFGEEFLEVNESQRMFTVANAATRYLLETAVILGAAVIIIIATVSGSAADALVAIGLLLAGAFRALPALSDGVVLVNEIRAYEPGLRALEDEFGRVAVPAALASRLVEQGDSSSDHADRASAHLVPPGETAVGFRFDAVDFSYPGATTPTLRDVSFEVRPGESVGIVGASGAGKSTMVDLLLGLLPPTKGSIQVAHRELRDVVTEWRSVVALVPQEVFILTGTVRDNIVFRDEFDAGADEERLLGACRVAHVDRFLADLPDGLDSHVGERGALLSGGQRQRLGLARAVYRRPALLILDEATSALDNETEFLVSEAIEDLRSAVTTLVIAHRLTTLRNCDRIIFLDEGRVAGIGSFEQLRGAVPAFARLVELGNLA